MKNALANIVRGGATAIVALVLPHFLTRSLEHDKFAAWALMLQIAAYANYLDFGLQTAIARYLAQAIERRENDLRDSLVSTAFVMLSVGGVLALGLISIVVWQLQHLFHGLPSGLVGEMRGGVLVLALSAALLLPVSTFTGVLVGLHRNELSAAAIGSSRILGAIAVVIASRYTHSLVWLASCIACFNLLGGLAQYAAVRKLLPQMRLRVKSVSRAMAAELGRYCSVLVFFSFGMLLISGLDVTIVGRFQFSSVGYYSVAATLVAFFTGLNNSLFGSLIAPVAVLQARGEYERIRGAILVATRLSTYLNVLLIFAATLGGPALLQAWVGPDYGIHSLRILEILLVGQAVRLLGNSYASALLATGLQRYAVLPGMIEAVSNLGFSVVGILWFGAIGVAWGTLLAAVLGICCYIIYTIRAVKIIPIRRSEFVVEGLFRPVICLSPLLAYALIEGAKPLTVSLWWCLIMAVGSTLILLWYRGGLIPLQRGRGPT